MQRMDARGLLATALMSGRHGAKKTGKTIAFRCPRHNDGTASAWLGDHAWGCSACGFTEGLTTLADTLGVELPVEDKHGLTLIEYAERKGLRMSTLREAGVEERIGKFGDTIIAMPYRDAEGKTIRTKVRTRTGTFWERDGVGTPLYGQDILARHPKTDPVLLVEGESDCHAGWQENLCVVGLPGASQWRAEYAPLLAGREVYVWQEPDEGGATMVSLVAKDIPKARVIKDVSHGGTPVKDLCDLAQYVAHDEDAPSLSVVVRQLCDTATPIGAEAPVVAFDSISGDTLLQLMDEKTAPIDAVPTPLTGWNLLCRGSGGGVGLARTWLVTIGANTGTGKSLIALNCAAHAVKQGEVVTFISLEMGRSELATRFLAIASGENIQQLEQGPGFNRETFERASRVLDDIRARTGGHVLMNRRPLSKLADVTASMKYYAETFGCKFFVVDYLQLAWTANAHSIHDRIELVSHQLRDLTSQLNVTTIALSQFNRQTSAARGERPVAQGLMGGSPVENDSHQVLLVDHSRMVRNGDTMDTWLIMDKNRHGSCADIPVRIDYRNLQLLPRMPSIQEEEDKHGRLTRQGRIS